MKAKRWEYHTSNIVKSFNRLLERDRFLPVIQLGWLDGYRQPPPRMKDETFLRLCDLYFLRDSAPLTPGDRVSLEAIVAAYEVGEPLPRLDMGRRSVEGRSHGALPGNAANLRDLIT
jgi:hypothetical protein